MKRWLARLSISFFIVGGALAWSAYQALQHGAADWRVILDLLGAAASISFGVAGVRIRHGKLDD